MNALTNQAFLRIARLTTALLAGTTCALGAPMEPAPPKGVAAAHAEPSLLDVDASLNACVASHESAKTAIQQQVLLNARDALRQCATPGCPMAIRSECDEWLLQAELQVPTLVLSAKTELGDIDVAEVYIDERLVVDKLTGQPLEADPGPHLVTFVLPDGRRKDVRIVVGIGEKNRVVRAEFLPRKVQGSPVAAAVAHVPAPSVAPRAASHPGAALAFGLVSLGSALLAGSFLFVGIHENNDATERCAPNCSKAEVSQVRRWFILADVAGGVSAVTGGLGLYLYLSGSDGGGATAIGYRGTF